MFCSSAGFAGVYDYPGAKTGKSIIAGKDVTGFSTEGDKLDRRAGKTCLLRGSSRICVSPTAVCVER